MGVRGWEYSVPGSAEGQVRLVALNLPGVIFSGDYSIPRAQAPRK